MYRLLSWTGLFLGSALGWWLGSFVGIGTAAVLSIVGSGLGMGAGRLLARQWF